MQRNSATNAQEPVSTAEVKESSASQPVNSTTAQLLTAMPNMLFKNEVISFLGVKEAIHVKSALKDPETKNWASSFFTEATWNNLKENEKNLHLFQLLFRGEQRRVQLILETTKRKDPRDLLKLLTLKYTIIDHAGRYFEDITLFQLALWYLDRHMWRMLLIFFKDEEMEKNSDATRKKIHRHLRQAACDQYREHRSGKKRYSQDNGENYQFEGKNPGQEGLATELQAYVDLVTRSEFSWEVPAQANKAYQQWAKGVGGAQARLPLHVVHEYCVDAFNRKFSSETIETLFKESSLRRFVRFRSWVTIPASEITFWEALTCGLGSTFAFYRSERDMANCINNKNLHHEESIASDDLAACRRLGQVRIEEYHDLEPELRNALAEVIDSSEEEDVADVESYLRMTR